MPRELLRLGVAAILGVAIVAAFVTFRIWQQGARDERRTADAIVVLGAAQYNGTPSPVFEARLSHAVDLWKAGIAPILVVTGGKAEGDRTTEAAAARAYALARGVPEAAILAEDTGRTTLESLGAVAVLLADRGYRTAVFVSDRTHMLRVLRIATDEGIVAWGSPTTTSPIDLDRAQQARATVHELGALTLYYLGVGRLIQEDVAAPGP